MAGRKILDDLLTHPSAFEQTSLGIRESPLQIGNKAAVGRSMRSGSAPQRSPQKFGADVLLAQIAGVLDVDAVVRPS